MDDSTIIFDEIIDTDVDAKLKDGAKPNKEETNFKTKLIKHKMILSISKILIQIILKQIKSHTLITLIYYIGYVMIKDSKYIKINTANPLYLLSRK